MEELDQYLNDVELQIEELLGTMHAVEESCSVQEAEVWATWQGILGTLFLSTSGNSIPDQTRKAAGIAVDNG